MSPGGGKTRLISDVISDAISSGMDPDRIYAITFTIEAARVLRERTDLRVNAMTIHSLAHSIVTVFGGEIIEGVQVYDRMISDATGYVESGSHPDIDLLCIDEAQDLDLSQYNFLLALARCSGRVIVVSDPDQAIYKFRGGDPKYIKLLSDNLEISMVESGISRRLPVSVANFVNRMYDRNIIPVPGDKRGSINVITEPPERISLVHRNRAYEMFLDHCNGGTSGILFRTNAEVSSYIMSSGKPSDYNYSFDITEHPFFALVSFFLTKDKSVDFSSMLVLARYLGYGVYVFEHFLEDVIRMGLGKRQQVNLSNLMENIRRSSSVAGVAVQSRVYSCMQNLLASLEYYMSPFELEYGSLLEYLKLVKGSGFSMDPFFDIGDERIVMAVMEYFNNGNTICRIDNSTDRWVMTVHAAKGLEFDNVIYMLNPRMNITDPEEFRIAYVAMTRTREHLMLYLPYNRTASPDVYNLYHALIRNAGIV